METVIFIFGFVWFVYAIFDKWGVWSYIAELGTGAPFAWLYLLTGCRWCMMWWLSVLTACFCILINGFSFMTLAAPIIVSGFNYIILLKISDDN